MAFRSTRASKSSFHPDLRERVILLYSSRPRSRALADLATLVSTWLACRQDSSSAQSNNFVHARSQSLVSIEQLTKRGFCAKRLSVQVYRHTWTDLVISTQQTELKSFNFGKAIHRQIYLDLPTVLREDYLPTSGPLIHDPAVLTDLATRWHYWEERIADVLGASPIVSQYNKPHNLRLPLVPARHLLLRPPLAGAGQYTQGQPAIKDCDPRQRFSRSGRTGA